MTFVVCERARLRGMLSEAAQSSERGVRRLRGFGVHVVESWLWDADRPWAAVTLSGSPGAEIAVDVVSLATDVASQHRARVERLLSPQSPAFSAQPTRLGTVILYDRTRAAAADTPSSPPPLALIPVPSGDYEAEAVAIFRQVTLKRLCVADTGAFWRVYGIAAAAAAGDFDAAAEALVIRAQADLVVLNYVRPGTFSAGRLDTATMRAIARCRAEIGSNEPVVVVPVPEPGFLSPGVVEFLAKSVAALRAICKRLGIKAAFLDDAAAPPPMAIVSATPNAAAEWSLCLTALGISPEESVVSRLQAIQKRISESDDAAAVVSASPATPNRRRSGSNPSQQMSKKLPSADGGEAMTALNKELGREKERRKKLEGELQEL
jgi:hypothetical protein